MVIKITVYGRDMQCASCVGAPSSKETFEWLKVAVERQYKDGVFTYEYIDFEVEQSNPVHQEMAGKIIEEDWLYPVIVVNDEIAGEGIVPFRQIKKAIDKIVF